ncbi:GNAT family N-acetyltransferase [Bacillus solimangrovi]|uniref:GNAT family N-acetyltransferase n=1 Tax=Bacillus solimangrovi TaxID=1305675 RepID=A0A1E5LJK8_9BACI|nr:GNAT family N-acetyltransferase [Bacillus solimangrovi]OEH94251.1 GNAT family N-acetyltransferase [Bacillus solimangrovi]
MNIRTAKSTDYEVISPVINEWWGGRQMAQMLPKLFFVHFNNTSFIAEKDGKVVGFLIGFLSQTYADDAYIHFVGVHPEHRKHNVGKRLYTEFFNVVKEYERKFVRAITSPVNQGSIAYHTKMGFEIVKGDREVNGVSVHTNYDGLGQDRVLFVKEMM